MKGKILFGFELETGKEVEVNFAHTVITGLTHESGKTTAIMGLIKRSGLKALIIKTKIGEKAITEGTVIPPFYKEDFDWEYASELLESSRKEKMRFERSWIIKYSEGAKNLIEFKKNIDDALAGKLRELDRSVLITIQAYLEKVLPELQYAPLSKTLDIRDGINIMDLERFKEETQSLIIRSVLVEVLNKEKNTIIVLPECWRYLPEKLNSPVKRPAESFIRQGATNNNYLFLDSQDVTGISKTILKQVSNWTLGYQREINEIKRTLDQLPISKKQKPDPKEIATLKLGQFFVATSDSTRKAYALPAWLDEKTGKKVALGKLSVEEIEQPSVLAPFSRPPSKEKVGYDLPFVPFMEATETVKKINELREDFFQNRNDFFTKFGELNEAIQRLQTELFNTKQQNHSINEDEIVARVLQKIPMSTIPIASMNAQIDKQTIIKEILAQIPKGQSVVYEVAPLEKLKKDFLQEAKDKLLKDINKLNDQQKKILKWIEQNQKASNKNEIFLNCFGKSATGGSEYTALVPKVTEMKTMEIIRVDTGQRIYPFLKERITQLIAQYGATPQEIEQVYAHIISNLLGAGNNG